MSISDCRLIDAATACYSIAGGSIPSDNKYLPNIGYVGGAPQHVLERGTDKINAATLGMTTDNWLVLAFRGTLPPKLTFSCESWKAIIADWEQDFEAGPAPWVVAGQPYGHVEQGFALAMMDLWMNGLETAVATYLATPPPGLQGVSICGHSKGAAMTLLGASIIRGLYPSIPIQVRGFATPMTCDNDFKTAYTAAGLADVTLRWQNELDAVPYLPWWPALKAMAEIEQDKLGETRMFDTAAWPGGDPSIHNAYVDIGAMNYIDHDSFGDCSTETGDKAVTDAWDALSAKLEEVKKDPLLIFQVLKAQSSADWYQPCICAGRCANYPPS
jgi:hypothetical protein